MFEHYIHFVSYYCSLSLIISLSLYTYIYIYIYIHTHNLYIHVILDYEDNSLWGGPPEKAREIWSKPMEPPSSM